MTDYLGNEINKGDIVLYNEKASRGYNSSFSEGIVIHPGGKVGILSEDRLEVYHEAMEFYERFKNFHLYVKGKFARNVINLTALGLRERVELDG